MSGHAHRSPSAAGHFEPYGARVRLRPRTRPLEAAPFLKDLLEDVASGCLGSGATVIGHLKCVLHTAAGPVPANLTSVRSGAVCRGGGGERVEPGHVAGLDLAVLVYGLSAEQIDGLVSDSLARLLEPAGANWYKSKSIHS